ncbi:EamA family transporter [Candidatus Woesearchaeota archaeon]|nr:EamA family transporter [Candidatus Woesearchaeota archaeon]MBT5272684.1 EamA family transporter [Candidatus Woesearchaeota archaeon]MBT6337071.1 EamA family transporter [Candidatus Woesearchaeota archaeon]MBT7927875.1 EamA family transporter [Candidatus Woesearchaeota archaeon]
MIQIAIALTIFATFMGATASLLLKKGSNTFKFNILELMKNWQLIMGLFLYFVGSLIFIFALKFADLSYLYPFISLSYVWTCLLSVKYLNEKMNMGKWVGVLLIIAGVSLIGFGS